jgi:hypothetical protein
MMRQILVLVLSVAATVAVAADPTTSQSMSGAPKPPPKKASTSKPKPLTTAEQRIMDVQAAKAKFMSAVGACAKPDDCDPASPRKNPELVSLLKGAEQVFMDACVQCASDKDCEDERAKIREGKGRYGYNVCVAKGTGTKPTDKKTPEKKPVAGPKPAATTAPSK